MTKKIFTLIIFFLFPIIAFAQEPADSLKSTTLSELVVEGDSQFTDASTTTYIVGKNPKKHAANGMQLLQMMAIPQLQVNPISKSVKAINGEDVAFFINGLPASQSDVDYLYCKDAIKVEYIVGSTDPRFLGNRNVVNFVMQKYEYGGYTRLDGEASGFKEWFYDGAVYSKFSYKKMTFDFNGTGNYFDVKRSANSFKEEYLLKDADGQDYWAIRKYDYKYGDSRYEKFELPLSFRATYENDKMVIRNSIGYSYTDTPNNWVNGNLDISSDFTRTVPFMSSNPSKFHALKWDGYYLFYLPKGYSLVVTPGFEFNNYKSTNDYSSGKTDFTDINNDIRQKIYSGTMNFAAKKMFGNGHNFSLNYASNILGYQTKYEGSTNYSADPIRFNESLKLNYDYNISKWSFITQVGLGHNYQNNLDGKHNWISPLVYGRLSYSPKGNHQISLTANYSHVPPRVSSPGLLIHINEFLYQKGSELKPYDYFNVGLNWWSRLNSWFTLNLSANYENTLNATKMNYTPFDDGKALLMQSVSDGTMQNFNINAFATFNLLNGKLSFMLCPQFDLWKSTGLNAFTKSACNSRIYASYYMGRFHVQAVYSSPGKTYSVNNTLQRIPNVFMIAGGWMSNGWMVQLSVKNPFCNTRYFDVTTVRVPCYKSWSKSINDTFYNAITLNVNYIFRYGKKVNEHDEVKAGIQAKTILERY